MEKTWTVYIHRNKINNKQYICITCKANPEHRWNNGRGYKGNPHFYSAIQKYGWNSFDHLIIARGIDEHKAKNIERYLIRFLNTQDARYGYNMTSGGDGTPDCHPSDETRAKLSYTRRRENLSAETLKRRSDGLRGRKFSEKHKRKIGDGNCKPVIMKDMGGAYIRTLRSAHDAELEYGVSHSHISQCCNGQRKSAGGYLWQFAQ